jgi:hypothetical protein
MIVQEYLGSLKEDKELDYLFPILLNAMGYRIVQTAKESKGQSQYGKDIIAVGKDYSGRTWRWYFEVKGFKDRDITDRNFFSRDGVRESILEAKYAAFSDSGISDFNSLPIKVVVVHNGILKTNLRPTFEGFINKEFPDGDFERWDIYYLTNLFEEFLFGEYLLSDVESTLLFKKTLAFLDMPEFDYQEFQELVRLQFQKLGSVKGRSLAKFFATLNILLSTIFHYAKENNNLIAAKECSKFLILYTWSWILKNKLEEKRAIITGFWKLVGIQHDILLAYFSKTYPVAKMHYGLFAENGTFYEAIGYPLRCFEFLDDLIYFFRLKEKYPSKNENPIRLLNLRNKHKDLLIELISNNNGFTRPVVDRQSIPVVQTFLFFADPLTLRQKDIDFISDYVFQNIHNILLFKIKRGILPELSNDVYRLAEAIATGTKPQDYVDSSSILLAVLWELLVIFDSEEMYLEYKHLPQDLSLQIPYINFDEFDAEQLLFEKNLHKEYYVECWDKLTDDFEDFKKKVEKHEIQVRDYRTDRAGFPFLRYLAHSYFHNEILPEEWRKYLHQ